MVGLPLLAAMNTPTPAPKSRRVVQQQARPVQPPKPLEDLAAAFAPSTEDPEVPLPDPLPLELVGIASGESPPGAFARRMG